MTGLRAGAAGFRAVPLLLAMAWLVGVAGFSAKAATRPEGRNAVITLIAPVDRTDVRDYVAVRYSPWGASYVIPPGSYLQYDISHDPHDVSFCGGVELVTDRGPAHLGRDQNGISSGLDTTLARFSDGKWYRRRFSLKEYFGATISEIDLVASSGGARSTGRNLVRYRDIRLVNRNGQILRAFLPRLGFLPYPLVFTGRYTPWVRAEVKGLIGAGFEPTRWLTVAGKPLVGTVYLKNYDARRSRTIRYQLRLVKMGPVQPDTLAGPAGDVKLGPLASKQVSVRLGRLAEGNWRPDLQVSCGGRQAEILGAAVSAISAGQMARRRAPFSKDGFGMGAVNSPSVAFADSMPILRSQGANYVQLRTSWSQFEVSRGAYDFSPLARCLNMARRCGMWAEIDFYSGYPVTSVPAWYRDQAMESNTGFREDGGKSAVCSIAYGSPAHRAGLRALAALLEKFGANRSVVAWNAWMAGDMDSFYGGHYLQRHHELADYSRFARAGFRRYVRKTLHLSLGQASRRYGMQIKRWKDLELPQPVTSGVDLRSIWRDFMNYRLWAVGRVQRQATKIIREDAPSAVAEYLYGGGLGHLYEGADFDVGVRNALKLGGSIHETSAPSPTTLAYLGTARRVWGVPFSIETAGTPARLRDYQHAMFELLTQGASGFTWIQSGGVLKCPPDTYGFGELRPALERMRGAQPVGKALALVYPDDAQLVDIFGRFLPVPSHYFGGLADNLEGAGYNYDIYTDRSERVDWGRYPAVMSGLCSAMDVRTQKALLSYVKSGGILILFTRTGQYTPGDNARHFVLLRRLGCHMPARPQQEAGAVTITFRARPVREDRMSLEYWQDMGALPHLARVLAYGEGGTPAVATWKVGRGEVYLWAGWPNFRKMQASSRAKNGRYAPNLFDLLLQRWTNIIPPLSKPATHVRCAVREKGAVKYIVLFNKSATPCSFELPLQQLVAYRPHAAEIVARKQLTLKNGGQIHMAMAPWGVEVVEVSPHQIAMPELDFPVRHRENQAPKGAFGGQALQKLLVQSVGSKARTVAEDHRSGNAAAVLVREQRLAIPVSADGLYRICCCLRGGENGSNLRLKIDGHTLTRDEARSSLDWDTFGPVVARDRKLRFKVASRGARSLALRWLVAQPVWRPVRRIYISRGYRNPGPFPGMNFNVMLPPETELKLNSRVKAMVSHWSLMQSSNGYFDFNRLPVSHGIVYVAWPVSARLAERTLLCLGVDYGLRLWLNGKQVFNSVKVPRAGPPVPDEFKLRVRLRAGLNWFVGKVAAGSQGWRVWLKRIRRQPQRIRGWRPSD